MTLNNKIAYCRKKAGMSQEGLAEVIGVSRQAISKWETGESTPEVGKLLLLARTFGVTTDWLLSAEEPIEDKAETEPQGGSNPYYHKSMEEHESYPQWIGNLPSSIGRLFKRFGWLLGVYVAVIGFVFSLFGGIVMLAQSYMFNRFAGVTNIATVEMDEMIGGFPSGMNTIVDQYNRDAGIIIDSVETNNPVTVIATIMLVIGVVMIIGGIILALVLKKYGKDNK